MTTQTTPQKSSITQRLRTDLGRSVGVTKATQLVWLTGLRAHLPTNRNSRLIKRTHVLNCALTFRNIVQYQYSSDCFTWRWPDSNYMYISMNFGTAVHVLCWEGGVFNRSCFLSVCCKSVCKGLVIDIFVACLCFHFVFFFVTCCLYGRVCYTSWYYVFYTKSRLLEKIKRRYAIHWWYIRPFDKQGRISFTDS